jgi:lipoic acid synthetase
VLRARHGHVHDYWATPAPATAASAPSTTARRLPHDRARAGAQCRRGSATGPEARGVTTVTRDDLPDGGAAHFAAVIAAIRRRCPEGTTVEALISDLRGDEASLNIILAARPDVLNHNVETVPRLYPTVRPQAVLARSLEVLRRAAEHGLLTKSGFMWVWANPDEVADLLRSLRAVDVSLVTIGHTWRPARRITGGGVRYPTSV